MTKTRRPTARQARAARNNRIAAAVLGFALLGFILSCVGILADINAPSGEHYGQTAAHLLCLAFVVCGGASFGATFMFDGER
jgi:hypothetical protein